MGFRNSNEFRQKTFVGHRFGSEFADIDIKIRSGNPTRRNENNRKRGREFGVVETSTKKRKKELKDENLD